jgi:acetoin utilization deacetylase AcuC-like enzyme
VGERTAFALCRPPGHHAHANIAGGYCYINNAAVAAQSLLAPRSKRARADIRVAILDVDVHHGNGTQHIFYARNDVFFASLHGDPNWQYPYFLGGKDETGVGVGVGFNANFPLPKGATDHLFLSMLEAACERIAKFAPRYLVVSLGADTFCQDPLGGLALTEHVYARIGRALAQLGLPTVFIMEGGYAIAQLGANVVNVLLGFEGRPNLQT